MKPEGKEEETHPQIRVFIADDHAIVREGLRFLLFNHPHIRVVGEASTGEEAVEQVRLHRPSVVLMDVKMPQLDGLEATQIIKQEFPEVGIIMLTNYEERDLVQEAIRAGASGYVLKTVSQRVLTDTIQIVHQGGAAFDPLILKSVVETLGSPPTASKGEQTGPDVLTPKEREILRLIGEGKTNGQIAQELHYAVGSIKNMIQDIFLKLQVTDRAQAVLKGIRLGILR